MSPVIITKPSKLIATLTNVRERAIRLEAEAHAERLAAERALRLARGTGDHQVAARHAHGPHFVGDNGSTDELRDAVAALVAEEPRTFQELIAATGARGNRISGVLVKLQLSGAGVVNIGTAQRALWSIPRPKGYRATSTRRVTEKSRTEGTPFPTFTSTRSLPRHTTSKGVPAGSNGRRSR